MPSTINIPRILYKYLPPHFGDSNADILPILDNHLIRYSQFSALNDKREGTRGLFILDIDKHLALVSNKTALQVGLGLPCYSDRDRKIQLINAQRILLETERYRKQYHNDPVSFSSEIVTEMLKSADRTNGFLSLSDNWKNETMWSHYTSSNTGVCIGFKTSSNLLRGYKGGFQGVRKLKKVSYSDKRVLIDLESPDNDFDLYFHKTSQWAYEQEWRSACRFEMLRPGSFEKKGENIYLLRFGANDIAEIYVGMDATNAVIQKVRDYGKKKNIPVWQVHLSNHVGMDRKSLK